MLKNIDLKPVLQILGKKEILIGIALVIFLILLWFWLPAFGITSILGRIACLVLSVFILWSLVLWKQWIFERRGANLTQELQAQQESIAGRQLEISILKEKMNEAIHSLKTSGLGIRYRGKAALYALPWFIIIGPSAAGKSTLIRNSGLPFPFQQGDDVAVKGFGGTRNCDWWFSDKAIILDTAGRYTTNEDDHQEWITFLGLLKKYRSQQPINGILVAISLSDILLGDERTIQNHIKIIRNRVEEITQQLGFFLPVFLIITKSDLIQGFETFFSNMNDAERNQVWGISLGQDFGQVPFEDFFKEKTTELYARLSQQRLRKMAIERAPIKKQEVYDFPEQFKLAIEKIQTFVAALCQKNPYQEAPQLFGIYLTSGEQHHEHQKPLKANEQNTFIPHESVQPPTTASKGHFIQDLFNHVIFAHDDKGTATKKKRLPHHLMKSSTAIACAVVMGLIFVGLSAALSANVLLLNQGVQTANELQRRFNQSHLTLSQELSALTETYTFYHSLDKNKGFLPWHLRLGLYRGNDLLSPLGQMMSSVLQHDFLKPTATLLETQLQNYATQWETATDEEKEKMRGDYYAHLKTYLMLCYPNMMDFDVEPDLLAAHWNEWLNTHSPETFVADPSRLERLAGLITIYLQQITENSGFNIQHKLWPAHHDIIEKAREQLMLPSNAKNLFGALLIQWQQKIPTIGVQDLVHGEGEDLFQSQTIPGIYTAAAWKNFVKKQIEKTAKQTKNGDWIMQADLHELESGHVRWISEVEGHDHLKEDLIHEYAKAYNAAWLKLIESTTLKRFYSLEDASKKLTVLSEKNGPIAKLLKSYHDDLSWDQQDSDITIDDATFPLHSLTQSFLNPLHGADSLNSYFKELGLVQTEIQRLATSSDLHQNAQTYAMQLLAGNGGGSELYRSSLAVDMWLNNIESPVLRQALFSPLLSPTKEAWRAVINEASKNIQKDWQTQVYPIYQQTIQNKFPFGLSKQEANIADVVDFFKPKNGLLWQFVTNQLSTFLEVQQREWVTKKWLGIGASFSPNFLNALTQAQALSDALLKQNPEVPQFSFQLYPIPTPGLSEIALQIGHSFYHYYNGPQQWHTFHWSAEDLTQETRLTAITSSGENTSGFEWNSPWGIFYLLKTAKVTTKNNDLSELIWTVATPDESHKKISFLLRTDYNQAFQKILWKPTSLPQQIFEWH